MTFRPSEGDLEPVVCRVIGVRVYPSFREMLSVEGLKNCLPLAQSLDEGVRIFHTFPQYKDLETELGVLAIRIAKEVDC